jgi:hypothetical protein
MTAAIPCDCNPYITTDGQAGNAQRYISVLGSPPVSTCNDTPLVFFEIPK